MLDLAQLLRETFAAHQIATEIQDGWVCQEHLGPAVRCRAIVHSEIGATITVQLDVEVSLPDGRLLVESFGSAGESADAATRSAYERFLTNSFHPLLSAVFGTGAGEQIQQEAWEIDGAPWEVFQGPIGLHDTAGPTPVAPPAEFLAEWKQAVKRRLQGSQGLHWARVFCSRNAGGPITVEALWDGIEWPDTQQRLARLDWPSTEGFYSVRNFVILKPRTNPASPEPGRDYRSVLRGADAIVARILAEPGIEDASLIASLVEEGSDRESAEFLTMLTPLAFSHVIFQSFPLAKEFRAIRDGKVTKEGLLENEPAFLAAREVGRGLIEEQEKFQLVLGRCAVFNVIQDALDRGVTPDEIQASQFSPPELRLGSDPTDRTARAPAPRRRPWWKFWE